MAIQKKKSALKKAVNKKVAPEKNTKNFQGTAETKNAPKEFNPPANIKSMDTNTCQQQFTPESADAAVPPPVVAPACVASAVAKLEKQVSDLNCRQAWQEKIHSNILENGNITHYYNIIPSLLIAGVTGAFVGLATIFIYNRMRTKTA